MDLPDSGGYGFFQDTTTGRVWLDLNNFFGMSHNQMAAAATSLGFTVASQADVQLTDSLPLDSGQWSTYAAIMGSAPNRPLIWGSYLEGGAPHGWGFSYESMQNWAFVNDIVDPDQIPNQGSPDADMNIWAYRPGSVVPDGGSTPLLLGLALGALAARKRMA